MEPTEFDFEFVVAYGLRTIVLHSKALAESAGLSTSADALRQRISAELNHYKQQLDAAKVKFKLGDELTKASQIAAARTNTTELARLDAPVAWCRGDSKTDLGLSQAYFAQEAANAIVKQSCQVTSIPGPDTGYATPVPMLRHWRGSVPHDAPVPVVVFIPPHELRTTAMLPLLAHEVSHTAVSKYLLLTNVKASVGSAWDEAVDAAASFTAIATGAARDEALLACNQQLESWAVELLCDALATAYCGPAYLYAFVGMVLGREIDSAGLRHPPAGDRVGSIWTLLESMDVGVFGQSRDPSGLTLTRSPSNDLISWLNYVCAKSLKLNDATERLMQQCTSMHSVIHRIALDHLGGNAYEQSARPDDHELRWRLENRIVSANDESGKSIPRRALIDVGWQVTFSTPEFVGARPLTILRSLDDTGFQDVLDRSLELSYIVEEWALAGGDHGPA